MRGAAGALAALQKHLLPRLTGARQGGSGGGDAGASPVEPVCGDLQPELLAAVEAALMAEAQVGRISALAWACMSVYEKGGGHDSGPACAFIGCHACVLWYEGMQHPGKGMPLTLSLAGLDGFLPSHGTYEPAFYSPVCLQSLSLQRALAKAHAPSLISGIASDTAGLYASALLRLNNAVQVRLPVPVLAAFYSQVHGRLDSRAESFLKTHKGHPAYHIYTHRAFHQHPRPTPHQPHPTPMRAPWM